MAPLTQSLVRVPAFRFPAAALGVRFLKYIAFLLFLINVRSWPLSWHLRVFRPVIILRIRFQLLRLSLLFKPRQVKQRVKAKWLGGLSPVGKNPLDLTVSWNSWASPDDCDFNLHLSNSCYAKSLDCARLQHALKCFPTLFRTGGWMALGGTHYNFLREIPILSRYEVRVSIAAWDNKWVYLVARYVSHPSKKTKSKSKSSKPHTKDTLSISSTGLPEGDIEIKLPPTPPNNALADHAPVPVLHTPGTPDSEPQVLEKRRSRTPPTPVSPTFPNSASGPYPGVDGKANGTANSQQSLSLTPTREQADSRAIAAALRTQARVHAEPDGATLHCVAVSALCFKIGRITVPPSLALACEGLCSGPEASPHANGSGDATKSSSAPKPYSHVNPPPFWPQVKRLRGSELDLRPMCAFLAGGWREVPEEERWWETAFGGEIEKKRQAGMEVVGALRKGMEEVQGL